MATAADASTTEPPAYEDRLIEGGSLAPLADDGPKYEQEGLPRTWRIEAFGSRTEQGATVRHESGLLLSARLDTLNYGVFSLDASLRGQHGSSVVTLWQRDLAFDNGWRANNGLGMLNTPSLDLARQQYRFYLPTFPIAGASTEWLQSGRWQLQASVGEPGVYDGLRIAGFSRLGGSLATAGAQFIVDPHWQVGMQFADARGVRSALDLSDPAATVDSRSWYGAIAWRDVSSRVQLNLQTSDASTTRKQSGAWIDGEVRDGRYRHNYGAFYLEPNLAWGYSPTSSDLQGVYYRVNYASQQWIATGGFDGVSSVSGHGIKGAYGTGSLRYQVDSTLGVGGGTSYRHSSDKDATASYAFVDKQSAFGTSRVQLDVVEAPGQERARQVTFDQAWPTRVGLRLSTSLTGGIDVTPLARIRRASLALTGGAELWSGFSIDGNIRFARDTGDIRTTGRYANLGIAWRFHPKWSLVATYYDNRSETRDFATLAPLVPIEQVPIVPRDRAVFLTLRYEDRAGTPTAPLGGGVGAGAGTFAGSVFYDANDDGRRNASETGAANVTVVLDGKYAVRTDKEGRFEFAFVASGPHLLTVLPDNLALPYAIASEGRFQVVVRTRETTQLDIAAARQK